MGHPFVLVTDNRAVGLILSNTSSRPPARIERMALRLSQFDFVIRHCSSKTNVADYYSRQPYSPSTSAFLEEVKSEQYINMVTFNATPDAITMTEIVEQSRKDASIQGIVKMVTNNTSPEHIPNYLAEYRKIYHELSVTGDGVLLRGSRLVVPASLRNRVVDISHSGHQGIVKTKSYIRSRVWFPGIDGMVEQRILQCRECQSITQRSSYEPLKPSGMPKGVWEEVSGDFFGPMTDGKYWFVNHCDYSRWASVDQISSTSFECVRPVLDGLFVTFGIPTIYKTDNGPPFQSYNFKGFAKHWGFFHRKITPLWPRANAEVEAFMRKLGKVLQAAKISGAKRENELSNFLMSYRATPHTTTKVPPAMLMLGRQINTGIPRSNDVDIRKAHGTARVNDVKAKARMKLEYDTRMHVRESSIFIGSKVLARQTKTHKNTSTWDPDPYQVINIHGSMVTATRSGQTITRNSSCFKAADWYSSDEDEQSRDAASKGPIATSVPMPQEHTQTGGFSPTATNSGYENEITTNQNKRNGIPNYKKKQVRFNSERTGKPGRPTKAESLAKEAVRQTILRASLEDSTRRASARLQNKRGGKM
jgi:hypothetical protein